MLTDGVLARPIACRRRFVDDHHRLSFGNILFTEYAPAQQWRAHGVEVSEAHLSCRNDGILSHSETCVSFGAKEAKARAAREWQITYRPRGLHPGNRSHALEQLPVERLLLLRLRVAHGRQRKRKRQQTLNRTHG